MTRTFNTRIVFQAMGALLIIEALFMLVPTFISFGYNEYDKMSFVVSTILTFLAGTIGLVVGRKAPNHVGEREGYLIVALVWVVFSVFGMLPYYLSGSIPSFTDAWFETMSGFTTTGATVVPDVEVLTHGALIWRSLTQWLGGMGIIVLSLAILPMFGLGGMQLYAAEVTGLNYEKLSPHIADTAKKLWGFYILLTAMEVVLLWVFGMDMFDSVCHSFSTIATGGFSTKNSSIAFYNSAAIHYTIAIFMLVSGINFALLIYLLQGRPGRIAHDEETHWYIGSVVICTAILGISLFIQNCDWTWLGGEKALRLGFFTVITTMTTTGYSVSDYTNWFPPLWVMVFFLMFTGACAGSTSGGIKWIRIAIFAKNGVAEFKRRIHPNAIIPVKISNKPVSQQTMNNLMAFMMCYIFILVIATLIFCGLGIPFDESIGTAVSAIGNVGVSIGQFGPAGTYASFPEVGKWVLTFVMLIGRLEIFTVLLLFTPALWKK